jgi:hypothetical protein
VEGGGGGMRVGWWREVPWAGVVVGEGLRWEKREGEREGEGRELGTRKERAERYGNRVIASVINWSSGN